MNIFLIGLVFITLSCASKKEKKAEAAPVFKKEVTCSPRALKYLKSKQSAPHHVAGMRLAVSAVAIDLKKCYEEDARKTNNDHSFNLCLVVGVDKLGKTEFMDYHTNEYQLSPDFYQCLQKKSEGLDLRNFKNGSLVQSIWFRPI